MAIYPIGGTHFSTFHEGACQVSKTYLSRFLPEMSHEWVPFPTKDVVFGPGCVKLHFKISTVSYEPSQVFQLQEISQKNVHKYNSKDESMVYIVT